MGVPCLLSHYVQPWSIVGSGSILKRSEDCHFAVLLDWNDRYLPILGLLSDKALDRVIHPKRQRDTGIFAKDFEIITVKEKEYGTWIVLVEGDEYTISEATICENI